MNPIAASKTKGQHVLIAKNSKGKYVIVDEEVTNGNKSNGSYGNTVLTQAYSQCNDNGHSTAVNHQEVVEIPLMIWAFLSH